MLTVRGVVVAFSWLTVLPVPHRWTPSDPDRATGRAVMAAVPVVGMALGALVSALAWGLSHTDAPPALIGILVVAALALLTRGMHVDGLADTADGLGCYGPPERVAEVMRSGSVGPFGVVTLIVVIAAEIVGFATLTAEGRWWELAFAITLGRVAAVIATRRSLPPAHENGFGSMVAGTQRVSVALWSIIAVGAGVILGGCTTEASGFSMSGFSLSGFSMTGATQLGVITLVALAVTWVFSAHCARRMGGITGDVLGAVIEIGTAVTLVGILL
ncbi:adenosylcobinamide-GDP ribazoletransferase [Gordonia sp. VNQ95]|jgi:adenosylcobinamide-GDP ribazoletransferase|uniref:adenosylcobinamide-GDP ribazoletransferase n=1 Tax=Gordonia TaxID=2053 RepID=UPI0032B4EDFE